MIRLLRSLLFLLLSIQTPEKLQPLCNIVFYTRTFNVGHAVDNVVKIMLDVSAAKGIKVKGSLLVLGCIYRL